MKEPFDSYDEFDVKPVYAVPQSHNVKTVEEVLEEVAIENKEAATAKLMDIPKVLPKATKSKSKKGKKVSEPVEMDIPAEENVGE